MRDTNETYYWGVPWPTERRRKTQANHGKLWAEAMGSLGRLCNSILCGRGTLDKSNKVDIQSSMPSTKTVNLSKAARLFHALSDETRLRVIEQLQGGEQCVCDLTETFKTGQSRLSFHLRVLKEAGLVVDRPDGRWVYYSLNQDAFDELQDVVKSLNQPSLRLTKRGCCP